MALGKRTTAARKNVDPTKVYKVTDAVKIVKGNAKAKFDETIEVALNLGVDPRHADQMVRGVVTLPNGTGRTLRVGVFARGAKAEEAKAKAAEVAKKEAADLGRYQDKSAERYFREMKAAGKTVPPSTWVPPAPPPVAAAQPSSSEALGQKQAAAPKTQNTANPAAAKASTGAKPTPAKG